MLVLGLILFWLNLFDLCLVFQFMVNKVSIVSVFFYSALVYLQYYPSRLPTITSNIFQTPELV